MTGPKEWPVISSAAVDMVALLFNSNINSVIAVYENSILVASQKNQVSECWEFQYQEYPRFCACDCPILAHKWSSIPHFNSRTSSLSVVEVQAFHSNIGRCEARAASPSKARCTSVLGDEQDTPNAVSCSQICFRVSIDKET